MKMLSALCVLVVFCAVACSRKVVPQPGTISHADSSYVKKDSTWSVKEVVYDTLWLPGDSVEVEVLIECDSVTNKPKDITIGAKGDKSKLMLSLRNGILNVKSKYDSVMKINARQKETIHHLSDALVRVNKQKQETIVKVEYKTHWYDTGARWIAGIVLLILIIYIVTKNLKPKLL